MSTVGEWSVMQRYRRRWHQAVPGLDVFAHRLRIPEDVQLKILEQRKDKKIEAKPRPSCMVLTSQTPNIRGALETGSSPAGLSSIPRATTLEEWPSSPEMDEIGPQPEPEHVPEIPQAAIGSRPQNPSSPPPTQPPRPRSPLTSSSIPQMQNEPASPESIRTSIQAVSGSQLSSSKNPPTWVRLDNEPSNGPGFKSLSPQHDHPPISMPQPIPGTRLSPVKQAMKQLRLEPPSKTTRKPLSGPSPLDRLSEAVVVHMNEMAVDVEIQDLAASTQSSLEYASTQDEDKVVADAEPPKLADKPSEAVSSRLLSKVTKQPIEPVKSPPPSESPKPASRVDFVLEQVDTDSKRKYSGALSAQDDSKDVKRQKVAKGPGPRKPGKHLSFVDPNKFKRPFHSKHQIRKISAQNGTTKTTEPSAVAQPDEDEWTNKYFNARFYREPKYPRMTAAFETEPLQKVTKSKEAAYGNGRDSGGLRPRNESRRTGTSNSSHQLPGKNRKTARVPNDDESPGRSAAPVRVQHSEPLRKDMERDLVAIEFQYPLARKSGLYALDLNSPPARTPWGQVDE
ncbi:hypothetical protein BDM02DRAFT_3182422 [Thelephora ganbajun]|uniref:Uncharacterized protein n=1 Tax=Thelephora ganbajun TaxID=370292 RepID=A0ACB6ZWG4_THEGA|nr:hypothetical protein BDM02DRAFT_3182422 [Thelephora ganbajun]